MAILKTLSFDKSQYRPGEEIFLKISFMEAQVGTRLVVQIYSLLDELFYWKREIEQNEGEIIVNWKCPDVELKGYIVKVSLKNEDDLLAEKYTAFDVASDWTLAPRYGFICDFSATEENTEERLKFLKDFHINCLHFYDNIYRHDQLLPETEEYSDPLGRPLSLKTVRKKVKLAKEYNMAPLAYSAVYSATKQFYQQHKNWALYEADGMPVTTGIELLYTPEDFLYIMNPGANSPWSDYLIEQFVTLVKDEEFEGIHIDQYGFPEEAYSRLDGQLEKISLADTFVEFINKTKIRLKSEGLADNVIFNIVNNWPLEGVAHSDVDALYMEVIWIPYNNYNQLQSLISEIKAQEKGKNIVLAAYLKPEYTTSILLLDAVIFAHGAWHIELGEKAGMLVEPYFPNYQLLAPSFLPILKRYYDFSVSYVDLLFDPDMELSNRPIKINNYTYSNQAKPDTIWSFVRENEEYTLLNLINFLGLEDIKWKTDHPEPVKAEDIKVQVKLERETEKIKEVIWVSPDQERLGQKLPFSLINTSEGQLLEFTIPILKIWDMVILKKGGGISEE